MRWGLVVGIAAAAGLAGCQSSAAPASTHELTVRVVDELPAGNTVPEVSVVVTSPGGEVLGASSVHIAFTSAQGWPVYEANVVVPANEPAYTIELTGGYGSVAFPRAVLERDAWVAVATMSPHEQAA
jgi:hypothetical protein